jgi:hypothetical protein
MAAKSGANSARTWYIGHVQFAAPIDLIRRN